MASNSGVATLRNFHRPQARENACWGAPQTRWTSGQIVPKSRCMDVDSIGANGAIP